MPRTFRIAERLANNRSGGILDIPHPAILDHSSLDGLISNFTSTYDAEPVGVVLPVASTDGLLFPVEGLDNQRSRYMREATFIQTVTQCGQRGLDVYLSVDPRLQFLSSDALHVEDIVGNGSQQICVNKELSQEVLSAILGTGFDLASDALATLQNSASVKGLVLDAVDLYGMGAKKNRIHLVCFCRDCSAYFESASPGLLRVFKTFPNPWSLLLRDSGSGIEHVDEVGSTARPTDVVGLARQRGYDEHFGDTSSAALSEHAEMLLKYMRLRHDQTAASLNAVFSQALEGVDAAVDRILICEGAPYLWTAGMFSDALDVDTRFTELWVDTANAIVPVKTQYRAYHWRRARYLIDAFFQLSTTLTSEVERATTKIAHRSRASVERQLRDRLAQALAAKAVGKTALSTMATHSAAEGGRVGFVGVGLTNDVGQKIIDSLNIAEGLSSNDDNVDSEHPLMGLLRQFSEENS